MSETYSKVATWLRGIAEDGRAARRFIGAKLRCRSLAKQRRSSDDDLAGLYRLLGSEAADAGLGQDIPAFSAVGECRQRLAGARKRLDEQSVLVKEAEERLARERDRHNGIISALGAEEAALLEAATRARAELRSVEKRIAGLEREAGAFQSQIDKAAQGNATTVPVGKLREQFEQARQLAVKASADLSPAREAVERATAAAEQKSTELAGARRQGKQIGQECEQAVESARATYRIASADVNGVEGQLESALGAFGQAIYASAPAGAPEPVAGTLNRVAGGLKTIARIEADRAAAQEESAQVRPQAIRFGAYCGGGVAALALLIVLIVVLLPGDSGGGGALAQAPAAEKPSGDTDAEAPATNELTAELTDAILKLPALAPTYFDEARMQPRFRATGKLAVQSWFERPDGGSLVRIMADAEQRADPQSAVCPVGVVMDVVIAGGNRIGACEIVRVEDADLRAFQALLAR